MGCCASNDMTFAEPNKSTHEFAKVKCKDDIIDAAVMTQRDDEFFQEVDEKPQNKLLLFQMSVEWLREFFSTWLEIPTLATFDSAMTNQSLRPHWHSLIMKKMTLKIHHSYQVNDGMVHWLIHRDLSVQNLRLADKNTERLVLARSRITDICVIKLALQAPHLVEVDMANCYGLTDASIVALCKLCPKLQALLNVPRELLTDSNMQCVSRCKELATFTVSFPSGSRCNPFLTDVGVIWLAHGCKKLQTLDLTGSHLITDNAVSHIADHCGLLTDLRLKGCELLTDTGLRCLSRCGLMQHLECGQCVHLSDSALVAWGRSLRLLESLDISGCSLVTNAGVRALARGCNSFECLIYSGCPLISDIGVKSFSNNNRRVIRRVAGAEKLAIIQYQFSNIDSVTTGVNSPTLMALEKVTDDTVSCSSGSPNSSASPHSVDLNFSYPTTYTPDSNLNRHVFSPSPLNASFSSTGAKAVGFAAGNYRDSKVGAAVSRSTAKSTATDRSTRRGIDVPICNQ